MEQTLLIIFWYGVLHAFGPDHLAAIANFSLGKEMKKAFWLTVAFALGHGAILFLFAQFLSISLLPAWIVDDADMIAALVILGMGVYILLKLYRGQIRLTKHQHGVDEHIHISFSKDHRHGSQTSKASLALSVGTLMGIGGIRGMLITLAAVSQSEVTLWMILSFISGVMVVFMAFGIIILQLNIKLLQSQVSLERGFGFIGVTTVAVAAFMLSGS